MIKQSEHLYTMFSFEESLPYLVLAVFVFSPGTK